MDDIQREIAEKRPTGFSVHERTSPSKCIQAYWHTVIPHFHYFTVFIATILCGFGS